MGSTKGAMAACARAGWDGGVAGAAGAADGGAMANSIALGIVWIFVLFRRKRIEIHARGKDRASGRDHNHPRAGIVVNVRNYLGQLIPECRDHAVAFFRPVQANMRDVVFNRNVETLELFYGHAVSPRSC